MARVTSRSLVITALALLCASGAWSLRVQARQLGLTAGSPADIDQSILGSYKWRNIGPERGGRSIAISGVKGRPNEGYFGATGGGLWKTTDKGVTWAPVTDGQIHSSSVGAVAVSETSPDTVWIGMGESCIRGNVMEGDGVYKSTDAGKTWAHVAFPDARVISKIRIDPTNANIVYVAAFGRLSLDSEARGVYKTTDGGATWRKVLYRDPKTAAIDLWIDRHDPKVIYAAMWEAFRKEYTMSSGGPGSGLFKSTDAGETWKEITRNPGLPQAGLIGKIGVTVSGADSNRVYALVENDNGGVFRSDDAGATWTLVDKERELRQRAFYYTHITADPHNKDLVYAQDTGTFVSRDGGKTFTQFGGSDSHDIWIDPDDSNHFMYANDGGGTETFTALTQPVWTSKAYSTAQLYHVVATAHIPYHLCGAQQDSSTICVPSNTGLVNANAGGGGRGGRGGGGAGAGGRGGAAAAPVDQTYGAGGAEPGYIAPDPNDPDIYYAGGNNGSFLTKINRRTNENREVGPFPLEFSGEASKDLVERIQWTFPIVFSTVDTHVLFTGTQHLWRSTNGGQMWDKLGGDQLTRHDPSTMGDSGGPITHDMNSPEVYATVFAIGPGKTDVNVIWTGSDDGLINVTRDGGKTFVNVTPKEMPDFGRVSIIDASKFEAGSAYVAVKKPLLGDFAPYIFRTHDFGKTWTKIVNGIGSMDYVHSVREDPTRKGLLYAATQHGVYISYNDGDSWKSLSLNLPDCPVSDLIVTDNDLAISTHGRGFYVLDHINPLREYTPAMATDDVVLYGPEPAIRSSAQSNAMVHYTLRKPVQSLTIDIVDPKGNVAKQFVGGSAPEAAAAPAGGRGGGGGGRGGRGGAAGPSLAPMGVGDNTVTWDLRYASATTFPGMILWGGGTAGPLGAPGTYTVRMVADGKTYTKTFSVRRNPTFQGLTDKDLQAQFDLAIQVRDKTSEANNAVINIRRIKADVADRISKSPDPKLKKAGDSLLANLGEVESDIYQVKNEAGQDPLNFPIKTNNKLASLLSMIDHGDGAPTSQSPVVFELLKAQLKGETDRLNKVLLTDLVSINAELKRLGLDPIREK